MKYSVETLPRMDADIKKKAGLYTNNTFKGENNFEKAPTLNGVPIGTNDLNGTNYLMVYGTGTPTDNADELQAAYDEAKKMPRFIGFLSPTSPTYIYAGQTFGTYLGGVLKCYKILVDGLYTPYQMPLPEITESEAMPVRTTVIVAPGEYNFGASAFVADTSGINIVSLTGNPDVIISSTEGSFNYGYYYGIKVTADNVLLKGIDCKTNDFYIANDLNNLICEYCTGGRSSFGAGGGTLTGTFNCCIGGEDSFGSDGGTLTGTLINCKLTSGTFQTPTGAGKIYNCIDGNGNLINYPAIEGSAVEIINDLTTGGTTKALSAEQGKVLKVDVDKKTPQFTVHTAQDSPVSGLGEKIFQIHINPLGSIFDINKTFIPAIGSIIKIKGGCDIISEGMFVETTLDGQDINVSTEFGAATGAGYTYTPGAAIGTLTLMKISTNAWITI